MAVQKHFGQLMMAIQEPQIPALAAAFFSDCIAASDTMQFVTSVAISKVMRCTCTAFLLAVVNHMEVHPGKFEQVVGILSQETNLTELAATMSETYRKFDLLLALTYYHRVQATVTSDQACYFCFSSCLQYKCILLQS